MELRRKIEQYQNGDPAAMSKMSEAAIFYALDDAKRDILALHEQNAALVSVIENGIEMFSGDNSAIEDIALKSAWLNAAEAAIAAAKGERS